jgi:hypothetical protein
VTLNLKVEGSSPSTPIPNPEPKFIQTHGGLMRRGVCVVGFLMPIDRSAHPIDKSAIAQAIFKLINNPNR